MAESFSEDQLEEFAKVFREYDSGNGMPATKISCALRDLGHSLKQAEVKNIIATVPDGLGGRISQGQFVDILAAKMNSPYDAQTIKESFLAFENGSSTMNKARFTNVMMKLGAKLNEEEMEALLKEVDDGSGEINIDRVISVVM
eukprot:CAMPEP_0195522020 /NCGR_PEP_ID=MMETSP0794_2-20130614/19890_1 /TAXON_ID=515487 /ORGANISM="Stephanopyxis turris, Strain CCMP 815" /LENGTH=143 /DNA_ID=CAMNT_0040651695 /DNA_START=51 /DNA_END=479 /DNA_ORIENTATION=-